MGKGCRSAKHQLFKDKAKNRVDDLQEMFSDLQSARKESRTADVTVLEEQVHLMLREWKAELNEPSPASSLLGNTHVSSDPPSETLRLLQLSEEEDDATSKLVEPVGGNPKTEPEEQVQSQVGSVQPDGGGNAVYHEAYYMNHVLTNNTFLYNEEYKTNLTPATSQPNQDNNDNNNTTCSNNLNYQDFNFCLDLDTATDGAAHMSDLLPTICPPPSAYLRPKCALWDCPRPAQGSDWCTDYCSSFHASLAMNECPPGMTPVLRPGGIDLKDGPLFAALGAKIQGKNVGIPVCKGAATAKSPWNAPEIFDLSVLEGELIREWLFFDKPRRAFESGTRKQRSLPDYSGRGWHESRKQVMKEFGGLKRSYYMDPQPLAHFEWHLYEYEINDCDAFALYRLEFKLADGKKSTKGKLSSNINADINSSNNNINNINNNITINVNSRNARGKGKSSQKDVNEKFYSGSNSVDQIDPMSYLNECVVYGPSLPPYAYSSEKINGYYGT